MSHANAPLERTHRCGELRAAHIDREVVLMGWVQSYRDLGGAVFLDLRDRAGLVQVVFDEADHPEAHRVASRARNEWVVAVVGTVRSRGTQKNPNLPTGDVEVLGTHIEILNPSKPVPFEIEDDIETFEEKRLEYRYLDLRRPKLQRNLLMRSQLNLAARNSLAEQGFVELETPYIVKYTPGGARNFLVPSRMHVGHFYALAESPQIYKQLFMLAGFDRYFQIAKCFRDEDFRLDRQPEFTQIDLEMSFAREQDVQNVMEKVVRDIFEAVLEIELHEPFPRLTYDEVMRRFGSDKPDLRFGLEHVSLTELVKEHDGGGNPLLKQAVDDGGIVKAMRIPAEHGLSRSDADKLEKEAKGLGAAGLGRAKVGEGATWTQSPFAKNTSEALRAGINEAVGAEPGDLVLFQFGAPKLVHLVMSHLRNRLGRDLGLIEDNRWSFLWVTEFPLFEHDEESDTYVAAHHPFTSPREEDVDRLTADPGACRARAYDLVLNGFEIAGGSVRIHRSDVQAKVFEALSISHEEQQAKFGFLLEALSYGAPPHAGIAAGVDRLIMLMTGASSLRDVIPFPKTQRGLDLMTGAPTPVAEQQLRDLFLQVLPPTD
jgi:aspartyl-tRNA synthetase